MSEHRLFLIEKGNDWVLRLSPSDGLMGADADELGFALQPDGMMDLPLGWAHRAVHFMGVADPAARRYLHQSDRLYRLSYAVDQVDWLPPIPDMAPEAECELKMYQKAAAQHACQYAHTLNCFDVGLGKSISACYVVNAMAYQRILIVCPVSLVPTWMRTARRFITQRLPVYAMNTAKAAFTNGPGVFILPVSRLTSKHGEVMNTREFQFTILDEVQFLKSPATTGIDLSKRSRAMWGSSRVDGVISRAGHSLCLSATPSTWPTEDYHRLHMTAQHVLNGRGPNQFQRSTVAVWNGGVKSVIRPLAYKMDLRATGYMCAPRRTDALGKDAMKEIVWHPVELAANGQIAKLVDKENAIFDMMESGELPPVRIKELEGHLMTIRAELELAKVPSVAEYVRQLLASMDRLVVFGMHRAALEEMNSVIGRMKGVESGLIMGGVAVKRRDGILQKFIQKRGGKKIIIANIKSAGVGLNEMVAAHHLVIMGLPWNWSDIKQIIGRLDRVTQTEEVIYSHLLAYPNSVETRILGRIQSKKLASDAIYG